MSESVKARASNARLATFICLAAALTVGSGLLHGRLIHRWKTEAMARLGQELAKIPEQFENWQARENKPLPENALRMISCAGYINRVYENTQTGDVIVVTIVLGPPEKIWGHSPKGCYQFQNYHLLGDQEHVHVTTEQQENSFWAITIEADTVDAQKLCVFYAWSDGGEWLAPDHPRFSYGGRAFLYRLQVMNEVRADQEASHDVCRSFIQNFLPAAERHIGGFSAGTEM